MDCPGPGRDERLSIFGRSCVVSVGAGTGTCLDEKELGTEGTGDASRAMEACRTKASVTGEPERCVDVAIGEDRRFGDDEPSPLSYVAGDAIVKYSSL
jgi:hypothetical protein